MLTEFLEYLKRRDSHPLIKIPLTVEELFLKVSHSLPALKSEKYMNWFRANNPGYDPHHLVSRRIDYLLIPLSRNEHTDGNRSVEANKKVAFFFLLPTSLALLFRYIKNLEDR